MQSWSLEMVKLYLPRHIVYTPPPSSVNEFLSVPLQLHPNHNCMFLDCSSVKALSPPSIQPHTSNRHNSRRHPVPLEQKRCNEHYNSLDRQRKCKFSIFCKCHFRCNRLVIDAIRLCFTGMSRFFCILRRLLSFACQPRQPTAEGAKR